MATADPVRRFIFDVYGYARIREFVANGKPSDTTMMDFFQGTIIGTYAIVGKSTKYISRFIAGATHASARPHWPKISGVKRNLDISHPEREGREYGTLGSFDMGKLYHIYNRAFFSGMSDQEIGGFLQQRVMPLFGSPEYAHTADGGIWRHEINAPDFRLLAVGSIRANPNTLIVDFNSPGIARDLDRIVADYYQAMQGSINAQMARQNSQPSP